MRAYCDLCNTPAIVTQVSHALQTKSGDVPVISTAYLCARCVKKAGVKHPQTMKRLRRFTKRKLETWLLENSEGRAQA